VTFEDSVVDGIPMPACMLRDGRIVAANARFGALLGVDRAVLLASADPFAQFISAEDSARLSERHRARVRGEPVPEEYDATGRHADGSAVRVRARASAFPLAGPGAILWLCTDESERERSRALIRGFVDAAVEAQRQTTVEDLFRVVREKLAELGLTFTLLAVEPQGYRVLGAATGPFMQLIRTRWPTWIPPGAFPVAAPGQQGLLVDDLPGLVAQAFGAARMPASPSQVRAIVAAVPVESTAGYLLSASGEHLDATVASAFGLFGKQLGASIDNARKLTLLARSNRELRAVNEVAFASARLGSGRALQSALEQLIDSLDLDSAALFRKSPLEGSPLELIGEQGFEPGWARGIAADSESPWSEAAKTGQPVLFQLDEAGRVTARGRRVGTPATGLPRLGSAQTLQALEPPSCIALPLQMISDQVNGVLIAARKDRPLVDDDLRLLGTVAAQVAVALQNATLLEQARRRVDELSLLLELGHEVVGALDLGRVLQVAARVSARVLRCACAYVFLPDPGGALLRVQADHDPDLPSSVGATLPVSGDSLTARAFVSQQALWSLDATTDPRLSAEDARRLRCRSTLAVPLVSHGRSLGAMALIERTGRVFNAEDVQLATHAAQLISAAIETATLFAHERSRADEMALLQRDLRSSDAQLAQAQAELIDRERLAALGELSASVAHEVRNPLGVIFNSMGSLRRILRPEGDAALLIDIVEEEADRLNRMVGDLLDYSRPLQPALQPVLLRALIDEAISSARLQAGASADAVAIQVRVAREVATIRADARLLRQALINLFLNSVQAMPKGGRLTVTARPGELHGAPAADITIADTGPGVPLEARTRIWQPFFTTKATGTGLGLAVVKRIVDGHGGSIALEHADAFTEFRLLLPIGA
jgi:two-component system sensor histidine kinase HydH